MPRPEPAAIAVGLSVVLQVGASAAPPGTNSMLVNHCRQKWAGDGEMIEYCIRKQVTEYRRAEFSGASQETLDRCQARYGSDYSMINACITNGSRGSWSSTSSVEDNSSPGEKLPAYVNGIRINTCSNGELCYYQMLRALQRGQ
jgi:hypothetical protein